LNIETGHITRYAAMPDTKGRLSSPLVNAIHQDGPGIFWLGTSHGLNRLDPHTGFFTTFTEKDGLTNNTIYAIVEDEQGHLWISTDRGLSDFDPVSGLFRNFDISDGLQNNEFNGLAACKSNDGRIFFGGISGINAFNPQEIRQQQTPSTVLIRSMKVYGEEVVHIDPSIDHQSIMLDYHQNFVSFDFVTLDQRNPTRNTYAYYMEGIDRGWVYCDNRHYVSYSNIKPGKYVFSVRGTNHAGVWNETGHTLHLVITPPFWQTWWFYLLCLGTSIATIFGLYKMRIRTIEGQKKRLELQVRERTNEISLKNTELTEQRDQIAQQNRHILSSIRYAKRIQKAILPLNERFENVLPEHFIIFRPKDIVSGDFYWLGEIDDLIVVAVVDCTGHGVPGAFMSMIGNTLLNQIVKEQHITDPASILEALNTEVRTALKQESEDSESHDGMDVCICTLEPSRNLIHFSGARRALYFVTQRGSAPEDSELREIPGNLKSIGGKQRKKKGPFENHEVAYAKGDAIYLTTDGLVDQNNADGKKFSKKKLLTFLQLHAHLTAAEQKAALLSDVIEFQGSEDQRDDITVIGIKL